MRHIGWLFRSRSAPAVLLLIAAGLSAWVMELGAILPGQAEVRNWSSAWIGLDVMEIAGLVLTAACMWRRSACLSAAAGMAAALFAVDAWLDVLTSPTGAGWYGSLAEAIAGEIPMTLILTVIAIRAAGATPRVAGLDTRRTLRSRSAGMSDPAGRMSRDG